MKAPVGAVVKIFYDGLVSAGDALQTPTGRVYAVLSVRVQRRGKARGRRHLRCMVAREVPAEVRVRPLHWYSRE